MPKPEYNMKGMMWPNKFKTEEKHPGFSGTCIIRDREFQVAEWVNVDDEGNETHGLKFTEMDDVPKRKEQEPSSEKPKLAPGEPSANEEDMPF